MSNPAPGFEKHPSYEVKIQPLTAELEVRMSGRELARSRRAVVVEETKHRPVWYVPLEDIDSSIIESTTTQTYCPFKGYASYWSVVAANSTVEDAIWAYLAPYDECLELAGYASFYTNKVDMYIDGVIVNKDGPGWTE